MFGCCFRTLAVVLITFPPRRFFVFVCMLFCFVDVVFPPDRLSTQSVLNRSHSGVTPVHPAIRTPLSLNNRELPRVSLLRVALGGWHTFNDVPHELIRVMSSKRVWSVCRYDYTSQRCRTVRVEIPER